VATAKIPLSLAIAAAPSWSPSCGDDDRGHAVGHRQRRRRRATAAEPVPVHGGFADVGNPELTLANGTFAFNVLGVAANIQYRVVSGAVASADVVVSASLG